MRRGEATERRPRQRGRDAIDGVFAKKFGDGFGPTNSADQNLHNSIGFCQKGKSVLFEPVPNLAPELKEAMGRRQLLALKRELMSYGLLALDGLGYVGFGQEASQLPFSLLSSRAEGKPTLATTNLAFEKRPAPFGDATLATAMVDRMANKATAIEIIGESCRVRRTKRWMEGSGTDTD